MEPNLPGGGGFSDNMAEASQMGIERMLTQSQFFDMIFSYVSYLTST